MNLSSFILWDLRMHFISSWKTQSIPLRISVYIPLKMGRITKYKLKKLLAFWKHFLNKLSLPRIYWSYLVMGLDCDPLKLSELMVYLRATFLKNGFPEACYFKILSRICSILTGMFKWISQVLIMQGINHNFFV